MILPVAEVIRRRFRKYAVSEASDPQLQRVGNLTADLVNDLVARVSYHLLSRFCKR